MMIDGGADRIRYCESVYPKHGGQVGTTMLACVNVNTDSLPGGSHEWSSVISTCYVCRMTMWPSPEFIENILG